MLHRDRELFNELSKTYKKIEYVLYVSGEINCKTDNTIFLNFLRAEAIPKVSKGFNVWQDRIAAEKPVCDSY